jgi:hypothetical protein
MITSTKSATLANPTNITIQTLVFAKLAHLALDSAHTLDSEPSL